MKDEDVKELLEVSIELLRELEGWITDGEHSGSVNPEDYDLVVRARTAIDKLSNG